MRNRWGCGETCFSGRLGRVGDGVVVSGREWLFACRMLLQRYTECMFRAPRGKKLQWGLGVERFSSRLENGEEVSLSFVSIEAGRGGGGIVAANFGILMSFLSGIPSFCSIITQLAPYLPVR